MHININTNATITEGELRQLYPDTLFPLGFAGDFADYAYVHPVAQPEFNPATHKAVALTPVQVEGLWQQAWDVVALSQQEIDDARQAGIPTSCTPAQALVALYAVKGITEDNLLAAINSITDPVEHYITRIAFARATEWLRGSQTTQTMAALLSLTESDMDDLFAYAVTVSV